MLPELLIPARPIEVVDVGANPIDGEPPYLAMLRAGLCRVTGFEPQPDALARLEREKGPHERYFPDVIGDGAAGTLRICASPGMTSLLEPDARILALLEGFAAFGAVIARTPVQTRRLDDIAAIAHLDFLKVDVQGAELDVLRGARSKLAHAVVVQAEVSFVALYEKQPPLGEVDLELRAQGFIPHTTAEVKLWPLVPYGRGGSRAPARNQLVEADIVYVRDFSRPERLDDEQLKHLALIAHHCYRSHDLALRCLMHLEERGTVATGARAHYLESLAA